MLALGVFSALEVTVVPVPIEPVLVSFMLADRRRIWAYATSALLGALAGALLGYGVGIYFFDGWVNDLVVRVGWEQDLAGVEARFREHGFVAVLAIAVGPVPFQLAMLAAGLAGYPVPAFLAACALGRGIRYFGMGLLVTVFGRRVAALWARNRLAAAGVGLLLALAVIGLSHLLSVLLS